MSERPVQYFTDEYLERCAQMTPLQILEYLEGFRMLQAPSQGPCKLISLKVEPELLAAFKAKAALENCAYQTQIKRLMRAWLS